jgi:hypothetical protein
MKFSVIIPAVALFTSVAALATVEPAAVVARGGR